MSILKKIQVNLPFPMLLKNLEGVIAMGLQPELFFDGQTLDHLSWPDVERASRKLREKKVSVTFHAPFMDLNPGAVDERVREITAHRFQQILGLVPHLHPRVIVFHPGYDRWRYDNDVDLWLEKSLLTWAPLVQQAAPLSVKMALENVFEEDPQILNRLLSAIDSPLLGYCLDAGHGRLFSKVPIEDWIEVLGSRLLEIHLHDNHGQADDHLPLGHGEIDFPAIFSALKRKNLQPIITIEPHQEEYLEPNLKELEKYL
jgi:sugar phosphate isomerase/epimerase